MTGKMAKKAGKKRRSLESAIGHVVSNFSRLELMVRYTTAALISPDRDVGLLVLANRQFSDLLNTLGALVEHRFSGEADASLRMGVHEAIKGLEAVEAKRNLVVHSAWFYTRQRNRYVPFRWRPRMRRTRGLFQEHADMEPEDVHQISDEILSADKAFRKVSDEVRSRSNR